MSLTVHVEISSSEPADARPPKRIEAGLRFDWSHRYFSLPLVLHELDFIIE
jgi:hypothetical protein